MDELKEQLESQRQADEKGRDALQQQHSQLSQELHDRIEELATENMKLGESEYFFGLIQFGFSSYRSMLKVLERGYDITLS